jgi:type II secretory pathway component PulJ
MSRDPALRLRSVLSTTTRTMEAAQSRIDRAQKLLAQLLRRSRRFGPFSTTSDEVHRPHRLFVESEYSFLKMDG